MIRVTFEIIRHGVARDILSTSRTIVIVADVGATIIAVVLARIIEASATGVTVVRPHAWDARIMARLHHVALIFALALTVLTHPPAFKVALGQSQPVLKAPDVVRCAMV